MKHEGWTPEALSPAQSATLVLYEELLLESGGPPRHRGRLRQWAPPHPPHPRQPQSGSSHPVDRRSDRRPRFGGRAPGPPGRRGPTRPGGHPLRTPAGQSSVPRAGGREAPALPNVRVFPGPAEELATRIRCVPGEGIRGCHTHVGCRPRPCCFDRGELTLLGRAELQRRRRARRRPARATGRSGP